MRHTHDCQEIWPLGEHRGSHLWNGWLPYHHSLVLDGCLVHMLLLLLFCILFLPGASVIGVSQSMRWSHTQKKKGYRFITPVLALVVVEVREGRETMYGVLVSRSSWGGRREGSAGLRAFSHSTCRAFIQYVCVWVCWMLPLREYADLFFFVVVVVVVVVLV
eukprot:gene1054-625_t